MPRLFTALEIPAALGESLSLLRGGLPGARWIDPENYHLTLRFIGDVDDETAREIAWQLGNIRRKDFELRLDGLLSFGGRKPRAIVAAAAQHLEPRGRRVSVDARTAVRLLVPRLALRAVLLARLGRRRALRGRGGLPAGRVILSLPQSIAT